MHPIRPRGRASRPGRGRPRGEPASARLAISRRCVRECRVQSMRDANRQRLVGTTHLRAYPGRRTPHAIQAASCLSLGEQAAFIAHDTALQRAPCHTRRLI